MKSIIAGLKWCAKFLENRFPEKLDLQNLATKDDVAGVESRLESYKLAVIALQEESKKQKEQIEKLSLYIGLSRPMQTVLREKMK